MNDILIRFQRFLKRFGVLRLVLLIFGVIILIILAFTVSRYTKKPVTPIQRGQFVAREGEERTLRTLLEDMQRQRNEMGELRKLMQQRATTPSADNEFRSYVYKDTAILAKIILDQKGFKVLQSKDNEYYLSINGILYKMPRLLYIARVARTNKYWLAIDDLGVPYVADEKDFTVKYLELYMDNSGVYQLKDKKDIDNFLKQVILEDGTIYRQLPDGVEVIHPDGTREFIKGAILKETKDGIGIYDKNGNLIKKLDKVLSSTLIEPSSPEAVFSGILKDKPLYKDINGFYYIDENGNKHYLSTDELMKAVDKIDSAQMVGMIETDLGNVPLYKDTNGYFYLDEFGNKHYVDMTPELLDKLIADNNGVFAMVDGKVRKILKDDNGYYYLDEQGGKHYVPFDQIKNNLVGTDVYIVNHDQFIKSKMNDLQKKTLDGLGGYDKIEMDTDGNIYVEKNKHVYKIDAKGVLTDLGEGELFVEDGYIKMKSPDGKVTILGKSIKVPMALSYENGKWYGIDEFGNKTEISPDDVQKYLSQGDYLLTNIDGVDRKLFKNDKGFFYIDENGNKIYVDDAKLKDILDKNYDLKDANFLGTGVEFVDTDGNRYLIGEDGSILKIAPDGTVTNLGKGRLYALKDGTLIFEGVDGKKIQLGKLDKILTSKDTVFSIGDKKFGFDENENLIQFGPGNKLKNLGEGELYFDEKGNLIFKGKDGTLTNLGKSLSLFKRGDLLSTADKIYGEQPVLEKKPVKKAEEQAQAPSFLTQLQNEMNKQKPATQNTEIFTTRKDGKILTGMDAIAQTQQIASLDYTKILSDSFLKTTQQGELGMVSEILIPGGTEISGYVMFGVLAPVAMAETTYDSYAFIKIDKDTLLKNGIDIGTYDAVLTTQTRGDMVDSRVMFYPMRITFYDPRKKRDSYYEGSISYKDLGTSGGNSNTNNSGGGRGGSNVITPFVRGTVLSEWDGLEGIAGIEIRRQDEMMKLVLSSSLLESISEFFRNYSSPYGALMGRDRENYRFENMRMSDALQQGSMSGLGDAFSKLTNFQLQLSQSQVPVIAAKGGDTPESRVRFIFPNSISVKKIKILTYENEENK